MTPISATLPFIQLVDAVETQLEEIKTALPYEQKRSLLKDISTALKLHGKNIPDTSWHSLDKVVSRIVAEEANFNQMLEISYRVNAIEFWADRKLPTRSQKPHDYFFRKDFYNLWVTRKNLEPLHYGDISNIDPPRVAMHLLTISRNVERAKLITSFTIRDSASQFLMQANFTNTLDLLCKSSFIRLLPIKTLSFIASDHVSQGQEPNSSTFKQIQDQFNTWTDQNPELASKFKISLTFKVCTWS